MVTGNLMSSGGDGDIPDGGVWWGRSYLFVLPREPLLRGFFLVLAERARTNLGVQGQCFWSMYRV